MTSTFGFIGLGKMGERMARRLLTAGHEGHVFDTSAEAIGRLVADGAKGAASAANVADNADIVFLSLPSPSIVEAVCLREIAGRAKARIVVDLSTTGAKAAASIATRLAAEGVDYIDAPVSGGLAGAAAGTLTLMTSGKAAALEEVRPMLLQLGREFCVGEAHGLGQTMKCINNLMGAAAIAIAAEGIVAGSKAGLDAQQMIDIINVSSGRNSATQDKFPRSILPRTFDFGFDTGLSHKDVRMCLEEADANGVPMVVGAAVKEILVATSSLFGADSDFTAMVKTVETLARHELPAYPKREA